MATLVLWPLLYSAPTIVSMTGRNACFTAGAVILFFAGYAALIVESPMDIGKAAVVAIVGVGFMIGAVALALGVDSRHRRRSSPPATGKPTHPTHGVRL